MRFGKEISHTRYAQTAQRSNVVCAISMPSMWRWYRVATVSALPAIQVNMQVTCSKTISFFQCFHVAPSPHAVRHALKQWSTCCVFICDLCTAFLSHFSDISSTRVNISPNRDTLLSITKDQGLAKFSQRHWSYMQSVHLHVTCVNSRWEEDKNAWTERSECKE